MEDTSVRRIPRPGVLIASALAVVAAAYSNTLSGPFVWDDRMLILDDTQVQTVRSPVAYVSKSFWDESPALEANPVYYRPLTTYSYAVDWARGGGDAAAFHVTNVIAHLIVCALLFVLAVRFGASPAPAAFAAALFGSLPRLTESVAWISGRTDVLAAACALAAVAVHATEPDRLGRRIAAAALLLAALLAKEVGIAAAVSLAVLEWARARQARTWRRSARNLVPIAIACAAYAALRVNALSGVPKPPDDIVTPARLLAPLQALGAYLLMLADPLRPRLQIGLVRIVDPVLVVAGIFAAVGVAWLARRAVEARWEPEIFATLTLALVPIALVLHVIPFRVNVVAADRFLYVPAAAVAVGAAIGFSRLDERPRRLVAALATLLVPALGASTYLRNSEWSDEERLWREAVRTTRAENVVPRFELGNVLYREGRFREALDVMDAALRNAAQEERPAILANVAHTLSELGQYEHAMDVIRQVLAAEPALPLNRYNVALIEARLLHFDRAEEELQVALAKMPTWADASRALETIRDARRELAELPEERPDEALETAVRRARIWSRLGRHQEAEVLYSKIMDAPDARAADLRAACGYLLTRPDPSAALRALLRLESSGLLTAEELDVVRASVGARLSRQSVPSAAPM